MIRRLRAHAAAIILTAFPAGLILAQTGRALQSTQPLPPHTHPEIVLTALLWILGGGLVVVVTAAKLVSYILGQRAERFLAALEAKLMAAIEAHNEDRYAHAAASEHNHGPMDAETGRIAEALEILADEIELLAEEHAAVHPVCALSDQEPGRIDILAKLREIRARRGRRARSPLDSPHECRSDDTPGADHRPLRGKG